MTISICSSSFHACTSYIYTPHVTCVQILMPLLRFITVFRFPLFQRVWNSISIFQELIPGSLLCPYLLRRDHPLIAQRFRLFNEQPAPFLATRFRSYDTTDVNLQTWAHVIGKIFFAGLPAEKKSIISHILFFLRKTHFPFWLTWCSVGLWSNFRDSSRSWSGDQRVMMSDNQKSPSRRNVDKMIIWHHSPSLWAWMNQKRRWWRWRYILKLENLGGEFCFQQWMSTVRSRICTHSICHTCHEIHFYSFIFANSTLDIVADFYNIYYYAKLRFRVFTVDIAW